MQTQTQQWAFSQALCSSTLVIISREPALCSRWCTISCRAWEVCVDKTTNTLSTRRVFPAQLAHFVNGSMRKVAFGICPRTRNICENSKRGRMVARCERRGCVFGQKSHASVSDALTTQSHHECWFFGVVGDTNGKQLLSIHTRHADMHSYVGLEGNSCNTLSGSQ